MLLKAINGILLFLFYRFLHASINTIDNICLNLCRSLSMKSLIALSAFLVLLICLSSCSGSRSVASRNHRTSCANAF